MAYFAPLPELINALDNALLRGVKVRILLPAKANLLSSANAKTIGILRRLSDQGSLKLYLSEDMVHTKFLMNEKEYTFGSCNLTARSFDWLGELNLIMRNGDDGFSAAVRAAAERMISSAGLVTGKDIFIYDPIIAQFEIHFM